MKNMCICLWWLPFLFLASNEPRKYILLLTLYNFFFRINNVYSGRVSLNNFLYLVEVDVNDSFKNNIIKVSPT